MPRGISVEYEAALYPVINRENYPRDGLETAGAAQALVIAQPESSQAPQEMAKRASTLFMVSLYGCIQSAVRSALGRMRGNRRELQSAKPDPIFGIITGSWSQTLGLGDGLQQNYTYNGYGELSATPTPTWQNSTGSKVLADRNLGWSYDLAGNRTAQTGADSTTYAATGSNPTNKAYGSLNEYVTITGDSGESSLKYDEDGNLTQRGSTAYTYDGENRLLSVADGGVTTTFTYDYMGRRIRKTLSSGADTKYLWAGWKLIGELSANGTTVNRAFVWGRDFSDARGAAGGAGALLAQIDGTTVTFAMPDARGNIVGYINGSGVIVAAMEYNAYGAVINSYGTPANYPFGFAGQYTDAESGLVYYGQRYYIPKHGRFINRDPIGEAGGANLFAFTANRPTNAWDVLGLDPTDEGEVWTPPNNRLAPFVVSGDEDGSWATVTQYENNRVMTPSPTVDASINRSTITFNLGTSGKSGKDSKASNKEHPDCAGLRARLAYAQKVESSQQRNFGENGIYAPVVGSLIDSELAVLRNPSDSGSLSSFSPFDNMSLVTTFSGAGAAYWSSTAGSAPTQTTYNMGRGMTGYRNVVGMANVARGVALGFGISGATMSATATAAAYQDGDWGGVISNGAATALGGISLIPGIGTTVGYAQAGVSAGLFLYQKSADAADYRNTLASARSGLATIGVAQRTIGNVAAEMAEKGCK